MYSNDSKQLLLTEKRTSRSVRHGLCRTFTIPEYQIIRQIRQEEFAITFTVSNARDTKPETYTAILKKVLRKLELHIGLKKAELECFAVVENHNQKWLNGLSPRYHQHGVILKKFVSRETKTESGKWMICRLFDKFWKEEAQADCQTAPYVPRKCYDGCAWEEYICKINWAQKDDPPTVFFSRTLRQRFRRMNVATMASLAWHKRFINLWCPPLKIHHSCLWETIQWLWIETPTPPHREGRWASKRGG